MDTTVILALVKSRLGISTTVKDNDLTAHINSTTEKIEGVYGITLDPENNNHVVFVADFAAWRYRASGGDAQNQVMPAYLKSDLHDLIIKKAGTVE